ncbi:MAG: metal ABC transporter ATP-binding protein [Lactobacillales bacterium]|jgi:iron/zinc/copper transport system ATP-binding protein|nr:metal ABC transporter ATP-binding protein [Lactobacillales bacterium]
MLSVNGLTVSYSNLTILKDVSTSFELGTITGIIGPNGAGKSTFIKGVLGIVKPSQGVAKLGEKLLGKQLQDVAYVEQRAALDLNFPISVFDMVLTGTYPKLGLFRIPGKAEKEKVEDALTQLGLIEYKDRQIGELSGGQLQKAFVARAMVQEAKVVILDEPFVGIDMKSESEIMAFLKSWRDEGKIILVIHHDLNKVTSYFDHLMIINRGIVDQGETSEVYTKENISRAFSGDFGKLLFDGGVTND